MLESQLLAVPLHLKVHFQIPQIPHESDPKSHQPQIQQIHLHSPILHLLQPWQHTCSTLSQVSTKRIYLSKKMSKNDSDILDSKSVHHEKQPQMTFFTPCDIHCLTSFSPSTYIKSFWPTLLTKAVIFLLQMTLWKSHVKSWVIFYNKIPNLRIGLFVHINRCIYPSCIRCSFSCLTKIFHCFQVWLKVSALGFILM